MNLKHVLVVIFASGLVSCHQPVPTPIESITISVPYELDSLDPHEHNTISDFTIASHFYEPLVRTDAQLRVRPCLAQSWESPDPLTWVFRLEPAVKFHSGKVMRAEDVIYSIRRLLESRTLEMRGRVGNVQEVIEIDPSQVMIRMKRPIASFLSQLNFVLIVPAGSTSESLRQKVDGTGPYQLVDRENGTLIRMRRNDKYWGVQPPLKIVTFLLSRTHDQAMMDLVSGTCRLIQSNDKEMKEEASRRARFRVFEHDSLFIKYLSYDVARNATPYCSAKSNPFKSLLVRKAIQLAIDRPRLVAGLATSAIPATQPIPDFVFGFDPEIKVPAYDPAEAASLLARAGFHGGFDVTLHVRRILQQSAELIKQQLAAIGIRVIVKALPDHEFFNAVDKRDASLFLTRFGCVTGDAGDLLEDTIHSQDPTGRFGISNYGGYDNPEVNRLIEQCAAASNAGARLR